MKKILVMTVVLIMLMYSLVGCNKGTDKETSETNKTEHESSEEATDVAEKDTSTEEVTTEESTEQSTQSEINTEDVSTEETTKEESATESTEEETIVYTYSELSKKMYVISGVNVRDLPSTDGNKLGKLSKADSVEVTGKCNETGWYRITYKGKTAYVSAKYLSDTKPKEESTTPSNTNNNNNNSNNKVETGSGYTLTAAGTRIYDGWVLKNGVYYCEELMPGGARYDAEFHAMWDGKTKADYEAYYAAEKLTVNGSTPSGGLCGIPLDYVFGSFAIYEYTDTHSGELIKFAIYY